MFCFIGSIALKNEIPAFNRKIADIDVIADFDTGVDWLKSQGCRTVYPINGGKTLIGKRPGVIYEVSIAWPGSINEEFLQLVGDKNSANLDELYTLKMSHRFLRNSPHFYKTLADIKLMRQHGASIPLHMADWFKRRERETYDYKHPNLDVNKNNFFSGDGVTYIYDHDSLHEAVAIFGAPLYRKYQKDESEVLCDREKWERLPLMEKRYAVAEEAAVLAIERSLIPFPGKWSKNTAFKFALMKVCTSITSGWFREFAWENHDEILRLGENYAFNMKFSEGLKNGVVKHASN